MKIIVMWILIVNLFTLVVTRALAEAQVIFTGDQNTSADQTWTSEGEDEILNHLQGKIVIQGLNKLNDESKRTIRALVINGIPTDGIDVRCQALNGSTLVQEFGYKIISPLSHFEWTVEQVDYQPNRLICYFVWGENYLKYPLYWDNSQHTSPTYSNWLINEEGLRGNIPDLGFVLVEPWKH